MAKKDIFETMLPKEEANLLNLGSMLNSMFTHYLRHIAEKFAIKVKKDVNILSHPARETTVFGIKITIRQIFIDSTIVGEVKLTEEGICYCIDEKYDKQFKASL